MNMVLKTSALPAQPFFSVKGASASEQNGTGQVDFKSMLKALAQASGTGGRSSHIPAKPGLGLEKRRRPGEEETALAAFGQAGTIPVDPGTVLADADESRLLPETALEKPALTGVPTAAPPEGNRSLPVDFLKAEESSKASEPLFGQAAGLNRAEEGASPQIDETAALELDAAVFEALAEPLITTAQAGTGPQRGSPALSSAPEPKDDGSLRNAGPVYVGEKPLESGEKRSDFPGNISVENEKARTTVKTAPESSEPAEAGKTTEGFAKKAPAPDLGKSEASDGVYISHDHGAPAAQLVREDAVSKAEAPDGTHKDVSVLAQVTDRILEQSKTGKEEFAIELYPKDRGKVSVRLSAEDGVLTVDIRAENPKTQSLILSGADEIKSLLQHALKEPVRVVDTSGAEVWYRDDGGFSQQQSQSQDQDGEPEKRRKRVEVIGGDPNGMNTRDFLSVMTQLYAAANGL